MAPAGRPALCVSAPDESSELGDFAESLVARVAPVQSAVPVGCGWATFPDARQAGPVAGLAG